MTCEVVVNFAGRWLPEGSVKQNGKRMQCECVFEEAGIQDEINRNHAVNALKNKRLFL